MFLIIAAGIALFIGMRSERARQAHQNWYAYKARIASMRGVRMRETARALLGVFLLVVVIIVLTGNGG